MPISITRQLIEAMAITAGKTVDGLKRLVEKKPELHVGDRVFLGAPHKWKQQSGLIQLTYYHHGIVQSIEHDEFTIRFNDGIMISFNKKTACYRVKTTT